jgi:ABC-type branched-subunit amino acid transport system permease subunit
MNPRIRAGITGGIFGLIMALVSGGMAAYLGGIIAGLIAGMLASQHEVHHKPIDGLRQGVQAGLVAGALVLVGQLLRGFVLNPIVDPANAGAGGILMIGLGGLLVCGVVAALVGAVRSLPAPRDQIGTFALIIILTLAYPGIDALLRLRWMNEVIPILVFLLMALGLNIVVGYAGLLDLGYAAFFAIGAYTTGMLASEHFSVNMSFWLAIWIAAAVAALFGLILGSPTLPLRGDYLAIVTLGFGEIVPILLTNLDAVEWIKTSDGGPLNLTGGDPGISAIAPPSLPIVAKLDFSLLMFAHLILGAVLLYGLYYIVRRTLADERAQGRSTTMTAIVGALVAIGLLFGLFYGAELPGGVKLAIPGISAVGQFLPTVRTPWYYLVIAIFAFSIFFINRLRRSRLGRAWMAMREDELAAASMGIDLVRTKLLAFAMGASFSGFAGAFFGAYLGSITPSSFQFDKSVLILCMVILGGLGNIPGVILGGLIIVSADIFFLNRLTDLLKQIASNSHSQALADFKASDYRLLLFGAVLVLMMLVRPEGLLPSERRKAELHADAEVVGHENTAAYDVEQANVQIATE